MSESPSPPCPEVDEQRVHSTCVHLLIRLPGDWAADRAMLVPVLETRTAAATAFARSPAFRAAYGDRIGVVRVQTDGPVPSVVASILSEQGIEVEDRSAPGSPDGPTCSVCGRPQLTPEQANMTDTGWHCPTCFRAWNVRAQPQLARPTRRIRIPPRVLWPLLVLLGLAFLFAVANELRYLSHMNQIIRQHMPRE